ncbi:hypothetical protein [Adhaeribacter pallidiroseus]|uniref:Uncharacterized protein n=1 Tax=Adhaeribacter pallidiroseus TaxID=2072847 RepID=A0A369QJU7_9BACT|nr:hypothetical protein [Adhaeribacter pallidiroseus]RDC65004.1 hypothetical protein AHMF7616_03626 [Adhaeribacter pallidiroseus]
MNDTALTKVEIFVLYLVLGLILFGIVLSRTDPYWFEFTYAVEDGFIEWMTVLPLLAAMVISVKRFFNLYNKRKWLFGVTLLGIAAFSFFAAGEELSWGQRLLGLESSDFFKKNNAQRETNFHNLIVGGHSINLLVFSRLLILVAALYLLVLPYVYQRSAFVYTFINQAGVPIPRSYQVIAFLLVFVLISLCPLGKRAELLEFGGCCLFFLIVQYPKNKNIYDGRNSPDSQ